MESIKSDCLRHNQPFFYLFILKQNVHLAKQANEVLYFPSHLSIFQQSRVTSPTIKYFINIVLEFIYTHLDRFWSQNHVGSFKSPFLGILYTFEIVFFSFVNVKMCIFALHPRVAIANRHFFKRPKIKMRNQTHPLFDEPIVEKKQLISNI